MITRIPLRISSSSSLARTVSRTPPCLNQPGARVLTIQRSYATPSPSSIQEQPSNGEPYKTYFQPPPMQPKPKRNLRPYIYAVTFASIGFYFGEYVNFIVTPPPLPEPGTHEDEFMVERLVKKAEKLPLIKSMMSHPDWVHHDAYGGFDEKERQHRLTTGPLGGSRGIGGFQRVFYNETTGEHVTIVYIGGAAAGWPGITHGGVIATLMDETLGRCAIRQFPGQSGVTANLELKYVKPIATKRFYALRSLPQKEGSTDRKQYVTGRMETLDGRVGVEAKGLFVVPKKFTTPPVTI